MKKAVYISVLVPVLFFFGLLNVMAQDWPQFLGPDRNSKTTAFRIPANWPKDLSQAWKINVGTGDASPSLVGNRIYLNTRQSDNEVVLCLDAATGKEIWKNAYPSIAVTGPSASQHPGPRGTPAVADGKVVTFGAAGILSCLDAGSGKVIWRKDNPTNAVPQFFTGMSPLIVDGVCIAFTGTKDAGTVLALDINTGNEKWKWSGDGPAYGSPCIMNIDGRKHIIIPTEKNLISLDLENGKLLWQIAAPPQQRFYNCVSPCIDGNKIYFSGQGTGIKAIEVTRQGSQYVTKQLWSNTEVGSKWNTPVLKNGYLYGFSDQRRIYCVNAADGKTAWIDNTTNSDFATLVDCGSVFIGFPSTGNLIVFIPDPESYKEIARYKVADTPVYAFAILTGNDIYVKDFESLILYQVK
jgi:outer membrane protein assembly factor BamB